ncbi:MAG: peptide ABC transporter substrate-binding protein [Micromonosporaceae bacterium]
MTRTSRGSGRGRGARVVAMALATALAASGCTLFGEADAEGDGGGSITVQTTNFPILDPQVVTNGMWASAQGLLEGLVLQNKEGTDVVPGVAEKWQASEDGLTYTFQLREDAQWSNGDSVTAQDFEWTYKRMLTPGKGAGVTLGANSFQPGLGIAGAADHMGGALKDWSEVGIKATGERELTFTLAARNPDFLMGLTHPSMLPLHPDTVEKHPKDWQTPKHWVGNGPFNLDGWVKNSRMTLTRNKHYWDPENVHLDTVNIRLIEGDLPTVGYENGEVDITMLNTEDVIRFDADAELKNAVRKTSPNVVAYLALLRSQNKALQDPQVREALSVGLDREKVAKNIPGAEPGPSLLPGSLPGWDAKVATETDIARAKELLADAGYPNGKGLPEIKIMSGLAGTSTPAIDAIVDIWQEELGVKVKADTLEAGVYVEKRWQVHPDDYAGFYYGTFSGNVTWPYYAGVLWGPQFLAEFSLPPDVWARYQKIQNDKKLDPAKMNAQLAALRDKHASPEAKKYGELVTEANAAETAEEQVRLYQEAELARSSSHLILPVSWNSTMYAVRSSLEGVNLRPTLDGYYFKGIGVNG